MDNPTENYNFDLDAGVTEVVVRHGDAPLVHVDKSFKVTGVIDVVQEYLKKEGVEPEEIKNSYVEYSYEGLSLNLNYAHRRQGANDIIAGTLKLHPELEKWQINKAKAYSSLGLASFVKMNRHFFEDRNLALSLVTTLQNIQVKTENEIENSDNKRGEYRRVIGQKVIASNIPDSFVLLLPVFVGTKPQPVKVEIEIDPLEFGCTLISPELKEIIDLESRAIIDEQLEAIRALYPELRIFQK